MSKKQPKTDGLEWLVYSLMAFNGSGYADMNSADDFIDSYIVYKTIKNKPDAVMLAKRHRSEVLPEIENLLAKTLGAGRKPSKSLLSRMQAHQNRIELL